jgi:hypothetical protein
MFWKKKPPEFPLAPHRDALNQMAVAVLKASGINFDASSKLNQALIGTFLFGMIYAHGMTSKLSTPDMHALALLVFKDTLHYTDSAVAEGIHACIVATSAGDNDTMKATLHRGIDGHAAYIKNNVAKAAANLKDIIEHFAK